MRRTTSSGTRAPSRPFPRLLAAIAALVVAAGLLTACGGGDEDETRTAPNGDKFNDADVAFATDMIPHHAQATEMANLTLGRKGLDPKIAGLAEEVRATQTVEIETMVDWLSAWGEPVPETAQDHANAHGGGGEMDHGDMPGMMSEDELSRLEAASGAEFERMWLEMMIEHHEGAVEMAATEEADGAFPGAVKLAEDIQSSQQKEIDLMQRLLDS